MIKKLILLVGLFIFISYNLNSANIKGYVKTEENNKGIKNIILQIKEIGKLVVTDSDGSYEFKDIKPGKYTITIKSPEYEFVERIVEVDKTTEINFDLKFKSYKMSELEVTAVSKRVEKITESPAAVEVLYAEQIEKKSRADHLGAAFDGMLGVEVIRSGTADFTINTRGFNNNMNRRILVLQDGRDNGMLLLNAQEWNSFQFPVEEFETIEFVRGPNAALYGANAFNGVINMKSYAPKDVIGTKFSILGGDYNTYRLNARHAGTIDGTPLSYKVTLGRSSSLNLSRSRTADSLLEYSGLLTERRPLYSDELNTFNNYGTFRVDYDFSTDKRLITEVGMSNSGNETYAFNLGRVLVSDLYKPFARVDYNSENLNIHTHFMNRYSRDSIWFLAADFYTFNDEYDYMVDAQYNFYADENEDIHLIFGASYNKQILEPFRTLSQSIDANFYGIYAQMSMDISEYFKVVLSGRFDESNIHPNFLSPRAAIIYTPNNKHSIRFNISRSFQRPTYNDLFRWSPIAPVFTKDDKFRLGETGLFDYNKLTQFVKDSISAISGQDASELDLGLITQQDPNNPDFVNNLPQPISRATGNNSLEVEKNLGFEIGYQGQLTDRFFFSTNIFYNRVNDFITVFVPNSNKNLEQWHADLGEEFQEYNDLATQLVYNQLAEHGNGAPLVMQNGIPIHALSNGNIGEVDQYGIEVGLNYYITDELKFSMNYSYYDFNINLNEGDPAILPNTPPHKLDASLFYTSAKNYDIGLEMKFVDEFQWLAGTIEGTIPSYTIFNLSAGYFITDHIKAGLYIYNLFNLEHYQVFGGTFIPRLSTIKISYEL